jgi:hypothetical protein
MSATVDENDENFYDAVSVDVEINVTSINGNLSNELGGTNNTGECVTVPYIFIIVYV